MLRKAAPWLLVALSACGASPAAPTPVPLPAPPQAAGGRVGVHGMVIFGGAPVFASHIPMFSAPHDMQVVLELELDPGGAFSDQLFTLQPRAFSLDDLVAGKLTTFEGDLYRGNFEDGGQRIGHVAVKVKRVLFATTLRAAAAASSYFLFGSRHEAFLVHALAVPTDRDQVVRVSVLGSGLDDRLAAGARVSLAAAEPRLTAKTYDVGDGAGATVRVERELSCLVGPDFAKPCE